MKMNKLNALACLICIGWLFASCQTDLPLPATGGAEKIILLGELCAGDSVKVRAGQSTSLSASVPGQKLIKDLSLSLKDGTGTVTALWGAEDFLSYTLFTLQYSSPNLVQPGTEYQLQGKHPQLAEVTATVHIPTPFTALVTGRAFSNYNGDSVLSLDLALTDPAAANAMYVIEVVKQPVSIYGYFLFDGNEYSISDNRRLYDSLKGEQVPLSERYNTSYSGTYSRQQMYTTDLSSTNLGGTPSGRLFRRIFLSGKSFGGTTHHTSILLPRNALYGDFGQYAQTVIYVKSVSADYYDFLQAYEQYDPSMGLGGNASPVKLEGNVLGGFGMVGGVYKWKLEMIY